jgi:hypothetical protein
MDLFENIAYAVNVVGDLILNTLGLHDNEDGNDDANEDHAADNNQDDDGDVDADDSVDGGGGRAGESTGGNVNKTDHRNGSEPLAELPTPSDSGTHKKYKYSRLPLSHDTIRVVILHPPDPTRSTDIIWCGLILMSLSQHYEALSYEWNPRKIPLRDGKRQRARSVYGSLGRQLKLRQTYMQRSIISESLPLEAVHVRLGLTLCA